MSHDVFRTWDLGQGDGWARGGSKRIDYEVNITTGGRTSEERALQDARIRLTGARSGKRSSEEQETHQPKRNRQLPRTNNSLTSATPKYLNLNCGTSMRSTKRLPWQSSHASPATSSAGPSSSSKSVLLTPAQTSRSSFSLGNNSYTKRRVSTPPVRRDAHAQKRNHAQEIQPEASRAHCHRPG